LQGREYALGVIDFTGMGDAAAALAGIRLQKLSAADF
jgi:hypothetical protein